MKNNFLIAGIALLSLYGCKEKAPAIDFGLAAGVVDSVTSIPASSLPAANPHNVLVEEYTGQTCTNCPAAHELLKEKQYQNPGRIKVIGLYITGPLQTKPHSDSKYDFRNTDATTVSKEVYGGVNQLPTGGVDRVPVGGNLILGRAAWGSAIDDLLNKTDSLNLAVSATLDKANREINLRISLTYLQDIPFKHNLSVVIVEDSLVDIQEYPSTDPVHPFKNENYLFTNIMRGMPPGEVPFGKEVLSSNAIKTAGTVFVRRYNKLKLPESVINPDKCRVIVFVNSTVGSSRILQCAEASL